MGANSLRVVALIDGEHHPSVARGALDRLAREHEIAAVLFAGGREKVTPAVLEQSERHYGRTVTIAEGDQHGALRALARDADVEAVFDLCGEPIVYGDRRLALASVALDAGLSYLAPGLRLTPPRFDSLDTDVPSVSVIGTGKRCGKTAVCGHFAALLKERGAAPAIVSMGRGGPPEPQLVRAEQCPDLTGLLQIARDGAHAASDYLEDAVIAGVPTVGCRRCGEGPAGEAYDSNLVDGVRLALTLDPGVLLLEGSGAALPPLAADRTICVTSAAHAREQMLSALGPYRLLRSDLVPILGADQLEAGELKRLKGDIAAWSPDAPLVGCALEPEPIESVVPDARVALFTTATPPAEHKLRARLAERDIDAVIASVNLARRAELERDLAQAKRERCDVYLTELKAAAVEVVAEAAEREGAHVVFMRNKPVSLPREPDLDEELLRLYERACASRPAVAG